MSQEGSHQASDASGDDHGTSSPAVVQGAPSPRGSSNHGCFVTAGADASGDKPQHLQELDASDEKVEEELYGDLSSFLPHVSEKARKVKIVKEAIRYIRYLECTAAQIENDLKQERALAQQAGGDPGASSSSAPPQGPPEQQQIPQQPKKQQQPAAAPPRRIVFRTFSATNVMVNMCNDDANITVCVPRRRDALTIVLSVLENHPIDVVTVQIASDEARTMFNVFTHVNPEAIQQLGGEAPASEDIYQLVLSEIAAGLSN
ncbi:hypothetical protein EJB05_21339 [Eragrostis curvula]|uniref:Plant bHLH transcription factor ACT-like domain-containing protein n=1 Tax=Eragrostis curvula TaxID=38414 RepID=A0A5J9V1G8_9POAL|nr:hypothetical protein EJB05_21339 [Eragrostis curvula]